MSLLCNINPKSDKVFNIHFCSHKTKSIPRRTFSVSQSFCCFDVQIKVAEFLLRRLRVGRSVPVTAVYRLLLWLFRSAFAFLFVAFNSLSAVPKGRKRLGADENDLSLSPSRLALPNAFLWISIEHFEAVKSFVIECVTSRNNKTSQRHDFCHLRSATTRPDLREAASESPRGLAAFRVAFESLKFIFRPSCAQLQGTMKSVWLSTCAELLEDNDFSFFKANALRGKHADETLLSASRRSDSIKRFEML